MATLKEFEEALRAQGMEAALAILERLRARDRAVRANALARRATGRRMTSALAREILRLHRTTTLTQQEIAFRLGVNQGRVNEVVKRGKWLSGDPLAAEALARDRALARADADLGAGSRRSGPSRPRHRPVAPEAGAARADPRQLRLGGL